MSCGDTSAVPCNQPPVQARPEEAGAGRRRRGRRRTLSKPLFTKSAPSEPLDFREELHSFLFFVALPLNSCRNASRPGARSEKFLLRTEQPVSLISETGSRFVGLVHQGRPHPAASRLTPFPSRLTDTPYKGTRVSHAGASLSCSSRLFHCVFFFFK